MVAEFSVDPKEICWFCHTSRNELPILYKCEGCNPKVIFYGKNYPLSESSASLHNSFPFHFRKFDDDEIRFNLNLYPQARYCNAACQKADWDRHKDFCMLMQKIKSQLKSKEGSEQM